MTPSKVTCAVDEKPVDEFVGAERNQSFFFVCLDSFFLSVSILLLPWNPETLKIHDDGCFYVKKKKWFDQRTGLERIKQQADWTNSSTVACKSAGSPGVLVCGSDYIRCVIVTAGADAFVCWSTSWSTIRNIPWKRCIGAGSWRATRTHSEKENAQNVQSPKLTSVIQYYFVWVVNVTHTHTYTHK